jgi:hypothetical protein
VWKVTPGRDGTLRTGDIATVPVPGTAGFGGDNGPAASALLNSPTDMTFGADGSMFIADTFNNRIRVVASNALTPPAPTSASATTAAP